MYTDGEAEIIAEENRYRKYIARDWQLSHELHTLHCMS